MGLEKDFGSRWAIEHHADALMKLAPLPAVESWRPTPTDTMIPRRIPDGLIDVKFRGHHETTPLVFEIETQPSADADRQILEAILLVRLARRTFPDALLVLLKPAGQASVTGETRIATPGGTVAGILRWHVIRLWEFQAEDLFALNDVGLAPWIPLTQTTQADELFLARCRDLIDTQAPPEELEEMRVVTAVLGGVRYNKRLLETIFLGGRKLIDSPILNEAVKELTDRARISALRDNIFQILEEQFGPLPPDIVEQVTLVADEKQLRNLTRRACAAPDLETFVANL